MRSEYFRRTINNNYLQQDVRRFILFFIRISLLLLSHPERFGPENRYALFHPITIHAEARKNRPRHYSNNSYNNNNNTICIYGINLDYYQECVVTVPLHRTRSPPPPQKRNIVIIFNNIIIVL